MSTASSPPADLPRQIWDVIVVGTGMGGATIGLRLAEAGRRVLFCDVGQVPTLRGDYPEMAAADPSATLRSAQRSALLAGGRYADTLLDISGKRPRSFVPFIGSGPGGSSALYGMALERFMPGDFADGRWPLDYAAMAPWYAAAEALFRVRGEVDPVAASRMEDAAPPRLLQPPPLSAANEELAGFFRGRGLHPYRLPSACAFVPDCNSCQSMLCARGCKNDANRICLRPALQQHGARLLGDCRVTGLRTDGRRVTAVQCRHGGGDIELQASTVILAAGALQSPLILMRSGGNSGAPGLGNRSGLVGRCLMRHLTDLYLVRPEISSDLPFDNRRKELAVNDFYGSGDDQLGTLQSFGRLPPAPMLLGALRDDLRASRWRWAAPALGLAKPLLLPSLRDIEQGWITLASITADDPHDTNAIAPHASDPAQATLRYRPTPASMQRLRRLRERLADMLRGRRWRRLPQADNNQRLAHVCGTCRFGDDPASSVLDRDCRVHEMDNLFVVDASFFPSSGGTNPSLTIAANALRVGERIVAGTR